MVEGFESAGLDEERETGAVSWQVYAGYVRATGSWAWVVISALLLIMTQVVNVANSLFLGWWSGDEFGLDQEMYMVVYTGEQGTLFIFFPADRRTWCRHCHFHRELGRKEQSDPSLIAVVSKLGHVRSGATCLFRPLQSGLAQRPTSQGVVARQDARKCQATNI